MKTILLIATLLVAGLAPAFAVDLTATFTPGAQPAGSSPVEFFIEQKAGTNWTVVATGAASPIAIRNVPPGIQTYRVKARWAGVTAVTGAGVSEASAEATAINGNPAGPSNFILATLTVEVRKDGTVRVIAYTNEQGQTVPITNE